MTKVSDLDIIYISYDEPKADEFFEDLKQKSPKKVQRVHGVKGFDAAHKAAARLSRTERFITVDGDNIVRPEFFHEEFLMESDYVYSFTALNTINGLAYGNGGVKIWPRKLVLTVDTHEKDQGSDFCWRYRYWQMNDIVSDVHFAQTPYMAFRAGFREAVKLSLVTDKKLATFQEAREKMYKPNLSRLLVWATIGGDKPNGEWAIHGARCGLKHLWIDNLDPDLIRDYDWFSETWKDYCEDVNTLFYEQDTLRYDLEQTLHIPLPEEIIYNIDINEWFNMVYLNPERHGPMIPDMKPLI